MIAAVLSGDIKSSVETAHRRSGVSGHARASHILIKRGTAAADSEITTPQTAEDTVCAA